MPRSLTATTMAVSAVVAAAVAAAPAALAVAPGPAGAAPSTAIVRLCTTTPAPGHAACFAERRTDVMEPAAVGPHAAPAGYGPADLRSAYRLPSGGSGLTVAIVDAYDDPSAASDLATYRSTYGLPALAPGQFTKVNQRGSTSGLPAPDTGWAGEISLDLDMVSATCPQCNILLVEADQPTIDDLGTAVNTAVSMGAIAVSNSYGGSENGTENASDSRYYNHPGVAITASSGDSGYGASYPATGAGVTAVGGTSLSRASNARGWSESAWTQGGSGCSSDVPRPSWQASLNTGCAKRSEADVAAVADPNTGVAVYQTYGGRGWAVYGGTSASSPIVAGIYALAGSPGTHPNADPYRGGTLFDVTSGINGVCFPLVQCQAGPGYDGPTGLGTPNGVSAFSG